MSPEAPDPLTVSDAAGLPPELAAAQPLWEEIDGGSIRSSLRAARLYPDGRLYCYSDRRRVTDQRGLPSQVPGPKRWRLDARIRPEAVSGVRGLLEKAGPEALALPESRGGVMDGSHRAFRFFAAGREKRIFLDGRRYTPQESPALCREVRSLIQKGVVPGGAPMVQD